MARHGLAHYLSSTIWIDGGYYLVCWAAVSCCVVGPLLERDTYHRIFMGPGVRSWLCGFYVVRHTCW